VQMITYTSMTRDERRHNNRLLLVASAVAAAFVVALYLANDCRLPENPNTDPWIWSPVTLYDVLRALLLAGCLAPLGVVAYCVARWLEHIIACYHDPPFVGFFHMLLFPGAFLSILGAGVLALRHAFILLIWGLAWNPVAVIGLVVVGVVAGGVAWGWNRRETVAPPAEEPAEVAEVVKDSPEHPVCPRCGTAASTDLARRCRACGSSLV
jgi:ribosomal protein L40E